MIRGLFAVSQSSSSSSVSIDSKTLIGISTVAGCDFMAAECSGFTANRKLNARGNWIRNQLGNFKSLFENCGRRHEEADSRNENGWNGPPTVLVSFDGTNGFIGFFANALVQGTDGNFYGTTYEGGIKGYGT